MPIPARLPVRSVAVLFTAPAGLASCVGEDTGIGGAGGAALAVAAAKPVRTKAATDAGELAMAMRQGFCSVAAEREGGAGDGRRVELVVGGDAAARATRVRVVAVEGASPGLAADLAAGDAARAMCAGGGRSIVIGGTAMTGGEPTLTVTSDGPVTVVARTVEAETLAGPVEVSPGGAAALAWGPARR